MWGQHVHPRNIQDTAARHVITAAALGPATSNMSSISPRTLVLALFLTRRRCKIVWGHRIECVHVFIMTLGYTEGTILCWRLLSSGRSGGGVDVLLCGLIVFCGVHAFEIGWWWRLNELERSGHPIYCYNHIVVLISIVTCWHCHNLMGICPGARACTRSIRERAQNRLGVACWSISLDCLTRVCVRTIYLPWQVGKRTI